MGSTDKTKRLLNTALFILLVAIAGLTPISTKAAANVLRVAAVLWLIDLVMRGFKAKKLPLAAPLLTFLLLISISTILSAEPLLSWDRMKTVSLAGVALLVSQGVPTLRHLRLLLIVLLASTLVTVAYTAWQYTAGNGVEITKVQDYSPAGRAGLQSGDIVEKVDRTRIYSPAEWKHRVETSNAEPVISLVVLRGVASKAVNLEIAKTALIESGVTAESAGVRRGRPDRAGGFFHHYFPYSEFLVFLSCLFFGLAIRTASKKNMVLLGLGFVLTSAALLLTLTRVALIAAVVGCFAMLLQVSDRRKRYWLVGAIVAGVALGSLWIAARRGTEIFSVNDPGTQYRLMMWRDSAKMIRAHPWFGVGLDSVAGDWQRWPELEAYRLFPLKSHFHSTLIQLAVECGILSALAWLWLLCRYFIFLRDLLARQRNGPGWLQGLVLGVYGGFLGSLLISVFQYNWGDAEAMMAFWLLTGFVFAAHRLSMPASTHLVGATTA